MTLWLAIVFIGFFIISVVVERAQDMKFREKLNNQNLEIIFVNGDEMDVKAEIFKEIGFFKLNNTGKKLSEIGEIKFVRYSTDEDYFLKKG